MMRQQEDILAKQHAYWDRKIAGKLGKQQAEANSKADGARVLSSSLAPITQREGQLLPVLRKLSARHSQFVSNAR